MTKSRPLLLLHRYLGLATGLLFLVTALTGVLLLYKPTLLYWSHPELAAERYRGVPAEPDHGPVLARLWAGEGPGEGPAVRRVRVPSEGWPFYEVSYRGGSHAYLNLEGDALLHLQGLESPVTVLFDLHAHWLAGHWGEQASGYVHLVVVLLLLLGLYAWWPRHWRKSLHFGIKGSWVKRWYSWHRSLGALMAGLLLVAVGTGVMMVFYQPVRTALTTVLGGEAPRLEKQVIAEGQHLPMQALYSRLRQTLPSGTLRSVSFPAGDTDVLAARKRMPGEWHQHGRSFIHLNPYTGEVVGVADASRAETGLALTQKIYPLHSAAVGGTPYRLAMTLAGLSALVLVFSGYYIWWWRRRQRSKATTRSHKSLVQAASSCTKGSLTSDGSRHQRSISG